MEARAGHCSRPPDPSAAAASDAPDEKKVVVKHPISRHLTSSYELKTHTIHPVPGTSRVNWTASVFAPEPTANWL